MNCAPRLAFRTRISCCFQSSLFIARAEPGPFVLCMENVRSAEIVPNAARKRACVVMLTQGWFPSVVDSNCAERHETCARNP